MQTTIIAGQDLMDVLIQSYSSVEFLFDFLSENNLSINDSLSPGQVLTVPDVPPVDENIFFQIPTPAEAKKVRIASAGQNLIDISIRHYGSVESLFDFLSENPELNINSVITPGQVLSVEAQIKTNEDIVTYFDNLNQHINTGDLVGISQMEGVGYWYIENDNIVQ